VTELIAEGLRAQRDYALVQLEALIVRGHRFQEIIAGETARHHDVQLWQHDCAAAIHQLAGGSKAHWLSRAYSGALMVRSAEGDTPTEATLEEIVGRVIDVLEQARQSLSRMDHVAIASTAAPPAHRFDFVHNVQLRPILEQAFSESERALDAGEFAQSLGVSCGIIEAILTDALENRGLQIANCGFGERIEAAEEAGLIRGGCRRLPPVARAYRDAAVSAVEAGNVSQRDARVARQVLHVVMRDLDPGR
jgi:hypothetical protein